MRCSVLHRQFDVVWCSALQCCSSVAAVAFYDAVHSTALQHSATQSNTRSTTWWWHHNAPHYNTLPRGNTIQRTVTQCNTGNSTNSKTGIAKHTGTATHCKSVKTNCILGRSKVSYFQKFVSKLSTLNHHPSMSIEKVEFLVYKRKTSLLLVTLSTALNLVHWNSFPRLSIFPSYFT